MPDSRLGNALSALQTLAAKEVYGIPMLLMIGWRGRPGENDEARYSLIGSRLLDNLRANDIPFEEMPASVRGANRTVHELMCKASQDNTPVALLVSPDTLLEYQDSGHPHHSLPTMAPTEINIKMWKHKTRAHPLSLSRTCHPLDTPIRSGR